MALDGNIALAVSAPTSLEIGEDGAIHFPSADFLYRASFVRSGSDLKLVDHDGQTVVVPRYFESDTPPLLTAPNGTVLQGDTVRLLAGPAYPGQYAQAGSPTPASPIGKVVQAEGPISVKHADGTVGSLNFGDPIFENDVVETGQATIGIRFSDGTIFSMSAGTRMVINHFVYDPNASSNSALFSVIKGTFTMFGGKVVETGDMKVTTPIATLGIRGSNSIGVDVDGAKGWLTTNATDPNGDLSKIEVLDPVTQQVIATLTDLFSKVVLTPNGVGILPTTPEEIADAQKLAQLLHHIYSIRPPAAPNFEGPPVKKTFFDLEDHDFDWVLPGNAVFIPYQVVPAVHEELRNTFPETASDTPPPEEPVPPAEPVNNAPTADDVSASGAEDAASIPITLTGADIDAGDGVVSFTLTGLPEGGTLYVGEAPAAIGVAYAATDNQLTLSFVPDADFNGEVSFTYTSFDGEASSESATATITVEPVNDVPEIGGVSIGAVTEDVEAVEGELSTGGILTIADVDQGQSSFAAQAATAGSYGTFTLDAAGNWTYAADNTQAAIQQLGAGQSLTETFTAVSSDGSASQIVTVTIQGTNDVPVIGGTVTGAVTEDVEAVEGELSTSGILTIADVDQGQSSFAPQATTAGSYGTFTLDAAGNWTYAADNAQAAIQQLGAGQVLTETFTAVSSDGSASQIVTVTIQGTNDVPVIGGVSIGAVTEDVEAAEGELSTSGILTIGDVDAGQSSFVAQAATAGSYGTFTLDAAGNWTYAADNAQGAIQQLGAGQVLTETFTAVSSDGSASQVITVTIQGTNDVPVIVGTSTGAVTEDATVPTLSTGGILTIADVDTGQSSFAPQAATAGSYGTFTLDAAGNWSYAANNAQAAIQQLGAGQVLTETFTAVSSDGSASQTVTVTIQGTNDVPVIGGTVAGAVTEDVEAVEGEISTGGTLTITDVDQGQSSFAPQAATAGSYGTFTLDAAGNWTYAADNAQAAIQQLGVGQSLTETFTAVSSDGSASQTVTVTIQGTNDVPVIGGTVTGAVTEDAGVVANQISTGGTLTIADVDAGQSSFAPQAAAAGSYGTFTLDAAGNWSYAADNGQAAIQQLGAGQSLTETFTAVSSDGSASQLITVTIQGTNDVPVIGGTVTGAVTEDVEAVEGELSTSGILTIADVDQGQSSFAPQAATAGSYGTFTLDAAGNWTYAADNAQAAIQQLGAGQSLTETFTAVSSDGTASQTVTVTIHGTNDVPVAVDDTPRTVAEDAASIGGNVLSNDIPGPEGAALTAVDFGLGGGLQAVAATGLTTFTTANGTYTFQADGAWTFDPNTNLNNASGIGAGFTYQITDGSGDTATALQSITVTDGTVAATPAPITLSVDEAALSTSGATGSNPSLTTETDSAPSLSFTAGSDNLTSFAFSNDLSGLVTDLNGTGGQDIWWSRVSDTQVKGFLDAGHTQLGVTLDLSAPASIAAGENGNVTVTMTLSDNLQHTTGSGPQISSIGNVGVVATDTDNDLTSGTVNLTVKDDVPTAANDAASVVQEGQDFNVVFVLDFSGSVNNTQLDQMLDAVRAAGEALFAGTSGDVSVQLVAFSSTATSYGPFTSFEDFSNQIAAINPAEGGTRPFNGGTDFTAAIQETMEVYTPVEGASNQIFFLSDGNPTEQTGPGGTSLTSATATAWNTFVNNPAIDISVQTIGVGSGISLARLQDLEVDGGSPILAANFSGLIDTLLDAVTPDEVSGNVLLGTDNAVGGGDDDAFGADGGRVQSITIGGVTYTYLPGSNVIDPSGPGANIPGDQLTGITTPEGGKLSFNFTTGAWSYTAPQEGVTGDTSETFTYTIVDGDGDTATANLVITVSNANLIVSTVDPLVLDMGAPGFEFSSLGDGVKFDINADGVPDQIAWTAGDDGILAYDVDSSGAIENGSEIFTPGFAGGSYADGLAALASLDSNQDGVLDAQDPAFDKLVVWQDADHDGISDPGELKSLSALGITGIDLDAGAGNAFIDGQAILAEGSFTYADGTTGTFVEVDFDAALGNAEAATEDDADGLDAEYETDNRATTTNAAALAAGIGFGVATAAASAAIATPVQLLDEPNLSATGDGADAASGIADLAETGPDGDAPTTDPLHGIPGGEAMPDTGAAADDAPSTQGLDPIDRDAAQSPPIESLTADTPAEDDGQPVTVTPPGGQAAHPDAASADDDQSAPSSGATFEASKAESIPQVASVAEHGDAADGTVPGVPASASPESLAERLAALDTNHDGLVDANDANYGQLMVWQDANHDGVADADELSSLADHGIGGISLNGNSLDGYLDVQSLLEKPLSGTPLVGVQGSDAQLAKLASLDIGDLLIGGDIYLDLDQALKDSPLTNSQSNGASASGPAASESEPGASSPEAAQQQADAPPPSVDSGAGQGTSGVPPAQQSPSQSQQAQANDGPAEAAGPNHAEAASITIHVDDGADQAQNHAVA